MGTGKQMKKMVKKMSNSERYKELKEKYRISFCAEKYNAITRSFEPVDFSDFDIIIKPDGQTYASHWYQIIKAPKEITNDDLALICDNGNCCFGYYTFANYIMINTN